MSEQDLAEILACYLDYQAATDLFEQYEVNHDIDTSTFKDRGVLTKDTGFVVTINGHEFHVTVQKVR